MKYGDFVRKLAASVEHNAPFKELPTPINDDQLDEANLRKWVIPFYMMTPREEEFRTALQSIRLELTEEVISLLLRDFNWRTRSVAALFAAIQNKPTFVETIGNLMLKSEVCYAGRSYALALASFGDSRCVEYLEKYLTHYLARKDLWFDQGDVLSALIWIDHTMGTTRHKAFMMQWNDFVSDKPRWNLERMSQHFEEDLNAIVALAG